MISLKHCGRGQHCVRGRLTVPRTALQASLQAASRGIETMNDPRLVPFALRFSIVKGVTVGGLEEPEVSRTVPLAHIGFVDLWNRQLARCEAI